MKKNTLLTFTGDFVLCGRAGLITEIVFTSLGSLRQRDRSLKGVTSLWMFPIYGLSAIFYPLSVFLKKHRMKAPARGLLYTLCIFLTEFTSGSILSCKKRCPWNYYRSFCHLRGVIRLDYAPLWFGYSLITEHYLRKRHSRE